jgi:hypothetical protein
MRFHQSLRSEDFSTEITVERPGHVDGLVGVEAVLRHKSFVANRTLKGTVRRMQALMHDQTVLVWKTLMTHIANKPFLVFVDSLHVVLEMRGRQVGFLADLTFVRAHSLVFERMPAQTVLVAELSAAQSTRERFFTAVDAFLVVEE